MLGIKLSLIVTGLVHVVRNLTPAMTKEEVKL